MIIFSTRWFSLKIIEIRQLLGFTKSRCNTSWLSCCRDFSCTWPKGLMQRCRHGSDRSASINGNRRSHTQSQFLGSGFFFEKNVEYDIQSGCRLLLLVFLMNSVFAEVLNLIGPGAWSNSCSGGCAFLSSASRDLSFSKKSGQWHCTLRGLLDFCLYSYPGSPKVINLNEFFKWSLTSRGYTSLLFVYQFQNCFQV